jgi:CubicO group peptidase (beta-lactamase class C family)
VRGDDAFRLAEPDGAPGLLPDALDALLLDAASQQSDALLVAVDDALLVERYFGRPPRRGRVMSVTKSVVGAAIGILLAEHAIPSLDTPVSAYFAEWAGERGGVTLRHLLTHTSGLEETSDALFSQRDSLAYARAQTPARPPGAFSYSNAGVMLLSGVIERAAREKADAFINRRVLAPLGVRDVAWDHDQAGNTQTPGGLRMYPRDVLRFGLAVARGGAWQGKQVLPAAWLAESTRPQPPAAPCYGLLWWTLGPGCAGEPPDAPRARMPAGFMAEGWGGTRLVVLPARHLVAVRARTPAPSEPNEVEKKLDLPAFADELEALFRDE